jgi:hypothetical protein
VHSAADAQGGGREQSSGRQPMSVVVSKIIANDCDKEMHFYEDLADNIDSKFVEII